MGFQKRYKIYLPPKEPSKPQLVSSHLSEVSLLAPVYLEHLKGPTDYIIHGMLTKGSPEGHFTNEAMVAIRANQTLTDCWATDIQPDRQIVR